MRLLLLVLLGSFAGAAWILRPPPVPQAAHAAPTAGVAPFAVVELFTSEGCSSCPPADRLFATLAAEARADDDRIFPLAFHVDYWNYLGWADPYSDAAFSARQRTYSRVLDEGVYTPQMIVNGRRVFVGSREKEARRALAAALKQPASLTVALGVSPVAAGRTLPVRYAVPNLPPGAVVHLAVVERGLSQYVARGENRGRTLSHENVVRVYETAEAGEGERTLSLPDDLNLAHASLIAYAQDLKTMKILGAMGLDLGE